MEYRYRGTCPDRVPLPYHVPTRRAMSAWRLLSGVNGGGIGLAPPPPRATFETFLILCSRYETVGETLTLPGSAPLQRL